MIDINTLYDKITNNKIYVNLKDYDLKENEINKENIFNNMTLDYIKKNNLSIKLNENIRIKTKCKKEVKYIENSFLEELSKITLLEIFEIKEKIKEFINSYVSVDYLKTLSRSYKKLRININNVLVKNLDEHLFNELFEIISKIFDFNIIIINDETIKLYKKYIIDEKKDYYIFKKITINDKINYIYDKNVPISLLLKDYKENLELKKLKQMKVEELKEVAREYNINRYQKKQKILEDLNKFI